MLTCQRLFHEGLPLLYTCNTIGLRIHSVKLRLYAVDYFPHVKQSQPEGDLLTAQYLSSLLSEFDKIHIDVTCHLKDELDLKDLILDIADYLLGKEVQVRFIELGDAGTRRSVRYEERENMKYQLTYFMLARCASFRVLNTTLHSAIVPDIVKTITSGQPVLDLWASLKDFKQYLLAINNICSWNTETEVDHMWYDIDEWNRMECAASDFDAVNFYQTRAGWMKDFQKRYDKACSIAYRDDELHGFTSRTATTDTTSDSTAE